MAWANLEFAGTEPFDQFARERVLNRDSIGPAARDEPQLFDFSVWQQCADVLADDVVMPKWFGVDLYSHASAHVHPVTGSAAPTLFLSAGGTSSGLHVDFLQTHFWMALCHGRKRWRLVSRDDMPLLSPRYLGDLNPCFPVGLDATTPYSGAAAAGDADVLGEARDALALVDVQEVVLEPGDLIFVPRGWPHQVENLETTVAISANFIDRSNVSASLCEAELLGLVSEDPLHVAGCLREAISTGLLDNLETSAPSSEHSPLRAFKARHGEGRTPQETQQRLAFGAKIMVATGALLCAAGWVAGRSRAAG